MDEHIHRLMMWSIFLNLIKADFIHLACNIFQNPIKNISKRLNSCLNKTLT
jgi:hypothetical protein